MMIMIKRLIVMLVLFLIIIGGITFFFTRDTNPTKESQHLSARITTLLKILDEGNIKLKSGDLKSFSSEARILIAGDQAAIGVALEGVGIKKIDKAITTEEADKETFTTLTNAALSGQYDASYKSVLAQKFDSTAALMREVKGKTPNKKLKDTLTAALTTMDTLQNKLATL